MNQAIDNAILVTGANGNLGKKLIKTLGNHPVKALVRSDSAQRDLQGYVARLSSAQVDIIRCDYTDTAAIADAASGCRYVVHLVGIIKESAHNSFERAHIEATSALLTALEHTSVERVF